MAATIVDIAKKAGVSTCWVSFVLRDHPRSKEVSPQVRKRIKEVAAELNYHRNLSAATIANGFNKSTIALIVPEREIIEFATYIRTSTFNTVRYFNEHGYGVRIYCANDLKKVFQEILSNQIQYVYITLFDQAKRDLCAEFCRKNNLKAVFCSCHCAPYEDFPSFDSDDQAISASLVEYLAGLGHTRIAGVFGPFVSSTNRKRHAGWLSGLEKCKLSHSSDMYIEKNGFSDETFLELLRAHRPTAIFAADSCTAGRMLKFCNFYRIPIPEAFSIVAFNYAQDHYNYSLSITGAKNKSILENIDRYSLRYFEGKISRSKFFSAEIVPGQSSAAPTGDLSWLEQLPENFENDRKWFPDNRIYENDPELEKL